MILTQPQLEKKCREWQKILRLQDWDVDIDIYRARNMANKEVMGECTCREHLKTAIVRILDPADYPDSCIRKQDMEQTLVHELLHIHFSLIDIKDDTTEDVALEQALHAIAMALVKLKREAAK